MRAGCRVGGSLVCLMMVTACTDPESPRWSAEKVQPSTPDVSSAKAHCPVSPRSPRDHALQGLTEVGTIWALCGAPRADENYKIVVRATGEGELSAVAVGPTGDRLEPEAIVAHTASNFERPGDEWGVFFTFDRPGCWRIDLSRIELRGSITLQVRPATDA